MRAFSGRIEPAANGDAVVAAVAPAGAEANGCRPAVVVVTAADGVIGVVGVAVSAADGVCLLLGVMPNMRSRDAKIPFFFFSDD